MRRADLFVLPSRFEGYGMAYAEAHRPRPAGGRHHASARSPTRCRPDAGVLVPPDDVDALAAALRRLIENPEERDRLAGGARARTTFPSWGEQAARFARVLERLA